MTTYNLNIATPLVAIPVGEYISGDLELLNMTQKELAEKAGIPTSRLNEIIKGKRRITAEQSIAIAQVMGYEDGLLYLLQAQSDIDKVRIEKKDDAHRSNILKIAMVL